MDKVAPVQPVNLAHFLLLVLGPLPPPCPSHVAGAQERNGGVCAESGKQVGAELPGPLGPTTLCLSHSFLPRGSGVNQPEPRTTRDVSPGAWGLGPRSLPWLIFSGLVDLERPYTLKAYDALCMWFQYRHRPTKMR